MDEQSRNTTIRRIFAMIDSGDYAPLPELMDETFVDHTPMGDIHGHDGFISYLEGFRAAFGQMHHEVSDIKWLDDETAVWLIRFRGRFLGEFMGQRGAGQEVDAHIANAGRIRNGRVTEHWGPMEDGMGAILSQMGVTLPPGM
jgi:predicted ester cyclase